ncbi:hypothetical protein ACFQU2_03205 [Siccirubricoccus deserti]
MRSRTVLMSFQPLTVAEAAAAGGLARLVLLLEAKPWRGMGVAGAVALARSCGAGRSACRSASMTHRPWRRCGRPGWRLAPGAPMTLWASAGPSTSASMLSPRTTRRWRCGCARTGWPAAETGCGRAWSPDSGPAGVVAMGVTPLALRAAVMVPAV